MYVHLNLFYTLTVLLSFESQAAKIEWDAVLPQTAIQDINTQHYSRSLGLREALIKPDFNPSLGEGCVPDCDRWVCNVFQLNSYRYCHIPYHNGERRWLVSRLPYYGTVADERTLHISLIMWRILAGHEPSVSASMKGFEICCRLYTSNTVVLVIPLPLLHSLAPLQDSFLPALCNKYPNLTWSNSPSPSWLPSMIWIAQFHDTTPSRMKWGCTFHEYSWFLARIRKVKTGLRLQRQHFYLIFEEKVLTCW